MSRPFEIGDRLHGFCSGYFGRDSYDCRTVEAVGHDWILCRDEDGFLQLASGYDTLRALVKERDEPNYSWCNEDCKPSEYWT